MNKLQQLVDLIQNTDLSYNEEGKNNFKKLSLSVLRDLRNKFTLQESKLWFNPGGVAVSGDAILMGMWNDNIGFYIQITKSLTGHFMYRAIKNIEDYTGGKNNWLNLSDFSSIDEIAERVLSLKNDDKS
jgi:hypothetical protein